jgi:hypothetical protein
MTLNRRTGSGSDLADTLDSTANAKQANKQREYSKQWNNEKLSEANRPGRYRFLFCG